MKRLGFITSVILALGTAASAQDGTSYQVDNFDLANGVRIQVPKVPPASPHKGSQRAKLPRSANSRTHPLPRGGTDSLYPLGRGGTDSLNNAPLTRLTNMTISSSLQGFTTGNAAVDNFIVESGKRNSVDPLLLYSIMHQESTFKPGAVSPKGARGLMQLMPFTARRFGVTSIFDPRQNIEGGARYMRFLLDLFGGNIDLALAGYNAGEGAVMKYGYRVPPYRETQEYVRRITRRYGLIRDPLAPQAANNLSGEQLAAARQKESTPLTIYEQSVFAVRLPDGRLQLVSQ